MAQADLGKNAELADVSWTAVRRDLETLGSDIMKLSEKSLSSGQGKVAEEAQRLKVMINELISRAETNGRVSVDEISTLVAKRPVTSLAVAFASGLAVAMLCSSQRR